MNQGLKIFIVSFLLLYVSNIWSFTLQRTSSDVPIKWERANITYNINIENSLSLTDTEVTNLFNSAINEWQGTPTINVNYTTANESINQNDIYFSDNSLLFSGSAVLGVTRNIFNDSTGEIVESDIVIRNNIFLNNDVNSSFYLGNVITHELGHSIGLAHSNELFATMFYSVNRGQYSLSHDDEHGHKFLYSNNTTSISGTVSGSDDIYPVFGATVKLISSLRGKVVASTISNTDGTFEFKDLDLNDVYYIYISPTSFLSPLPAYYASVRSDFCSGFVSYRSGFYESCNASRRGRPQGIKLTSSNQNVSLGNVTIKCQQDVPLNYFDTKSTSGFDLTESMLSPGDSVVGFFTGQELASGATDTYQIDLSSYNVSSSNLYLDVSLVSHDLYSQAAYSLKIESPVASSIFTDTIDSDGNPYLNIKGEFPLDSSTGINNVFTISIDSKSIDDYLLSSSFIGADSIFPELSNLGSDRALYQLIVQIKEKQGLADVLFDSFTYDLSRDNSLCMQGEKTYSVRATAATSTTEETELTESSSAVACGSIDIDGSGSGGGPFQIVLGFLIVMLMKMTPWQKQSRRV